MNVACRRVFRFAPLLALAALICLPGIAAAQSGIQGTVNDSGGLPVEGASVTAYFGDCVTPAGYATTDAFGFYEITPLDADTYCVLFEPPWGSGDAPEWYNDQHIMAFADLITVGTDEVVTGKNAQFEQYGAISGTVSSDWGAMSGTVYVSVYDGDSPDPLTSTATDSAAGYLYTVGGLPAGTSYKVYFTPDYLWNPQWYSGKTSQDTADKITVAWGATTADQNVQLVYVNKPGSISGTITTADAGVPAAAVTVRASSFSTTREISVNLASGGAYTIDDLPPDYYQVAFIPPAPYMTEYYNNAFDESYADWLEVQSEQNTPNINAQLDKPGSISGTVTTADAGVPAGAVTVRASSFSTTREISVNLATGGAYTINDLPQDSYQVAFLPPAPYMTEYYNNRFDQFSADSVPVQFGATTPNIDAQLDKPGSISGKAQSFDGSPLSGDVQIEIYGSDKTTLKDSATAVAANGYVYTVNNLPPGTYYVKFIPQPGWSWQWYDRKAGPGSATQVVVAGGTVSTGIDAFLEPPGGIKGEFTGVPFGVDMSVSVFDEYGDQVASTDAASPAYTYQIELPAGSYYVEARTKTGRCYYSGGPCQKGGKVQVPTGAFLTIDYAVPPWGRIAGNVSSSAGGTFNGSLQISVDGPSFESLWSSGGAYAVDCLAPGSYTVFFDPQNYYEEWYNDKTAAALADTVTVQAGVLTENVNAVLEPLPQLPTGGLSGTVHPEPGSVFAGGVLVTLYGAGAPQYAYAAQYNGYTYAFENVPPGDYTVRFEPEDNHLAMWYQDSPDTPTVVHVTAGPPVTGIDTTLPVGGRIVGTVTDESGASLGGAVWVVVFDGNKNFVASSGIDPTTNQYEVVGLPAGSYSVYFSSDQDCPRYVPEWFDNVLIQADATPIAVTLKATATASATIHKLPAPGSIAGKVAVGGHPPEFSTDVFIYDLAGFEVGRSSVGICNDTYQVCVPPGSYKVRFVPTDLTYANQWFNGKGNQGDADAVVVIAGEDKVNIDAGLIPRGVNHAPVLGSVGNKEVVEGQLLAFTLDASDEDGDIVWYGAANLPTGAYLNPDTGQFSWTPTTGSAAIYPGVVFSVTDGALSDSETITITVTAPAINHAPVLDPVGNRTVQEGRSLSFSLSATDIDAGTTLTYGATSLPAWGSVDATTGEVTLAPPASTAGSYPGVVFSVSDGSLSDTETITITVSAAPVNHAPELGPVGNKTVQEGLTLQFTLSGTDIDAGTTLAYGATNLPAWGSVNATTGEVTLAPPASTAGSYPGVVFSVSDGSLSDTETITITVTAPTEPPVAAIDADPNPVTCPAAVLLDGAGSHADPPRSIVSYQWDFEYDGANFAPDAVGSSVSHTYGEVGGHTVALRVTDDDVPPRADLATAVVDVGGSAPTASAGGPYAITEGQALMLTAAGSGDPDRGCGDAIVAYGWDLNNDGNYNDALGATLTLTWQQIADLICGGACTPGNPYPVGVMVVDRLGLTDTAASSVTIGSLNAAVRLTSPNGGEFWGTGEPHAVSWVSGPAVTMVRVYLSPNGRDSWVKLFDSAADGAEDWTPDAARFRTVKRTYKLKIVGYNGTRVVGSDLSDKPFGIGPLDVTAPDGGEELVGGDTYQVTWKSYGTAATVNKTVVKYTLNGGGTWKTAATLTGKDPGFYDWPVPAVAARAAKCRVKVLSYDAANKLLGSDQSQGLFAVVGRVELTAPEAGDAVYGGTSRAVSWVTNTGATVTSVVLKYTLNGGTTWKSLTIAGNPGVYYWDVPVVTAAKPKCRFSVALKSGSTTLGSSAGAGFFVILPKP